MICKICEKPFEPKNHRHVYCSDTCSKVVKNLRRREYYQKHKKNELDWSREYYQKNKKKYKEYYQRSKKKRSENKKKKYNHISYFKDSLVEYFIEHYCEKGYYVIQKDFLYSCFQSFVRRFKIRMGKHVFCKYIYQKGVERSPVPIAAGLRLNQRGVKKFGIHNISNLEVDTPLTFGAACVLVSCTPGQRDIIALFSSLDEATKTKVAIEKTLRIYRKIETFLFKINKIRASKVKMALAFYLANRKNGMTQKRCVELTGS